jgi:hypothetical protein
MRLVPRLPATLQRRLGSFQGGPARALDSINLKRDEPTTTRLSCLVGASIPRNGGAELSVVRNASCESAGRDVRTTDSGQVLAPTGHEQLITVVTGFRFPGVTVDTLIMPG